MNEFWLNILQWALGSFVAVLLWSLRTAIKGGYWLQSGESLKNGLATLEARFDKAGGKMSDLASAVQALPDRVLAECDERYMSLTLSEERWSEERRIRSELEERLRDVEIQCARTHGRGR